MPANFSPHGSASLGGAFRASSRRTRRGRLACWAIALTLTTGIGAGVATARTPASHTTSSGHVSSQLLSDSTTTGVTGGPGNG